MGGRPDSRTVGLSLPLFLVATSTLAQSAPNTTTRYLFPTDLSDARALWVNPAGLGVFPEASVHLDFTTADPGASGKLRQLTFGLNSRGLSLGYQRDLFRDGRRGHTYRVGVAAGRAGLAAGLATALYRGSGSGTGWDLGILYRWTPALSLGGAIQNVGGPHVRDSTLRVLYVPGATLQLGRRRLAVSTLGRLTADGVEGYAFGLQATLLAESKLPIGLVARLDTDRSLDRRALAFGIALGRDDAAGLVATTPGDVSGIDALSLYGVSTRRFDSPRPRPPLR